MPRVTLLVLLVLTLFVTAGSCGRREEGVSRRPDTLGVDDLEAIESAAQEVEGATAAVRRELDDFELLSLGRVEVDELDYALKRLERTVSALSEEVERVKLDLR